MRFARRGSRWQNLISAGTLWLLRDEFTTDLAAGSVNGTAAEPGPGTRTVTDTNGKVTLAGGAASFATGGSAAGDPGLWYDAVTRTAGRPLIVQITPADTNGLVYLGLDSAQEGLILDGIVLGASGVLQARPNGTTLINVGSYTATTYLVAYITRTNGNFLFIKGGAFTNWTLVWFSPNAASAAYPGVAVGNTTTIFTAGFIRVPAALWLPTPLISDGFASAFGTSDGLGHAEGIAGGLGAGGDGVTWTGATWSVSGGKAINTPVTLGADAIVNGTFTGDTDWTKGENWAITTVATATAATSDLTAEVAPLTRNLWYKTAVTVGSFAGGTVQLVVGSRANPKHNADGTFIETQRASVESFKIAAANFTGTVDDVSAKPLTFAELISSVVLSTANVVADVALVITSGYQAGLCLNLDSAASPANFVLAYHDRTSAYLAKCVAGTYTTLIQIAATYSAGARLIVTKDDTKYRLYYNNVLIGTEQTISDAGIISNTRHGLFSTDASNTLDDFLVYARGNGGEYSALDTWSFD